VIKCKVKVADSKESGLSIESSYVI
jgi:hypothetical protein